MKQKYIKMFALVSVWSSPIRDFKNKPSFILKYRIISIPVVVFWLRLTFTYEICWVRYYFAKNYLAFTARGIIANKSFYISFSFLESNELYSSLIIAKDLCEEVSLS